MDWRAIWPRSPEKSSHRGINTALPRPAGSAGRRSKQRPGKRPVPSSYRQSAVNGEFRSSQEKIDPADIGLALLGFAAGVMDALAFFHLGEVFPSAMTGNTAMLGLMLGQGDVSAASRPAAAFAGFLAGAAAAASADLWLDRLPSPRAVFWLLALEACLLAAFALAWRLITWPAAGAGLYGLIVAASFGMGIQGVAARMASRPGITTIVFTSTLTAIVASVINAIYRTPHKLPFAIKRQIATFCIYGAGAAICGLLASHGAAIAILPFAAVAGAAFFHRRSQEKGRGGG
jgi:uncharacterized membrane protein YoaK (UPF0700 family)